MYSNNEKKILRDLAQEWIEKANQPEMEEKKKGWRSVKDLNAHRPMILVETRFINNFVAVSELECNDPFLRNVEYTMKRYLRQASEVCDDIVIEPYYRFGWEIIHDGYGAEDDQTEMNASPENSYENYLGTSFNHCIKSPDDVNKLKVRNYTLKKDIPEYKAMLEDIIGDILPVWLCGYNPTFNNDYLGYQPRIGTNIFSLTMDLFKLIGNENLLLWVYDYPEEINRIMSLLLEDRRRLYTWLEKEKILALNSDNQFTAARSYGYVSDLPAVGSKEDIYLSDLWGWAESQETEMFAPDMFGEFFLPYLAELSKMFGLIYYGCCERVDDRWELIKKVIPNLRAVSVSAWSNLQKMGEKLGRDYVYSRKPNPAFISGAAPNWGELRKDIENTWKAAKNCSLEIIFRDIYDVNGERKRLSDWVEMARAIVGL